MSAGLTAGRLTGPRSAALALASGAASTAELRTWLVMLGMLPAREAKPAPEPRPVPGKRCPRCGETRPASEFYPNRCRYDGLCAYCKPCMLAYVGARRTGAPESLLRREAARLLAVPPSCAWCGTPVPDTARRRVVYCSARCRQAQERHRYAARQGGGLAMPGGAA